MTLEEALRAASALRESGHFAEAEAAYQKVLAENPALPSTWYNLGWVQRQLGRFEEALVSYQRALDRGVTDPEEVFLNRAVILSDHLHREGEAERELRAALTRNPRYTPALFNLANLHEDRGQRDAAQRCYAKVLEIDPDWLEALARLANVSAITSLDDPIILRLRGAIASLATPAEDRASLGFALGRALDACGAYDDAFAAYTTANRASAGGRKLYDRAAHERVIDALIDAFPLHEKPLPQAAPALFICGMFRSGSTLIEQVVSGHPSVTAGGEIAFLPMTIAKRLSPFPDALRVANLALLEEIASDYRAEIARVFPDTKIVTDKRPDNFLLIGLIKTLFPDAKIIHTRRNALDNCLSVFFLHLDQSMGYAFELEDIAHYYTQYRRLMAHWEKLYGGDIHTLDYDALVGEPEPVLRALMDFCGLDWTPTLLNFHTRESVVKTASVWQVREPLYQRSSGRWRHYEKHLAGLRAVLGPDGEP